jgi:hypothetical protein
MVYTGIIVLEPKERHSYEGREPLTDEEYYEMTFDETDRIIRDARGVPIHIEHLGAQTCVGRVVQAGYDASRRVCVRFELDKTRDADVARNLIQAGYLRGLSLAHVRETSQPIEISLCFRGARPGTGIIACSETTAGARKQPGLHVVQASARPRSLIVQASASMDASSSSAAAAATPPVQLHTNSVMNLVAQATGAAQAPAADAPAPTQALVAGDTDPDVELEVMKSVLQAAGVSEDKKQRVLAQTAHNYDTIKHLGKYAADLEQKAKLLEGELERERKTKGDLTGAHIAQIAKYIRAMDGDTAISPELDQRIKETHKDPLGTWNAMMPAVVQASATAMRWKEEAQRRSQALQSDAAYQQYVASRTAGWEAHLPRPAAAQTHVVEASRGAAPAQQQQQQPSSEQQQQQWSYERTRDDIFKRKISALELTSEVPKRPVAEPVSSFAEVRRMLARNSNSNQ